jgi:hypothetical protein
VVGAFKGFQWLEGLKGFRKAGMRVKRDERFLGDSGFVEF